MEAVGGRQGFDPDEQSQFPKQRRCLHAGKERRQKESLQSLMKQSIIHVALVVRDYDEALRFFCDKLNFTLVEDTYQPEQDKRWVLVSPAGASGTNLLLARASTPEQAACIGKQTGGRVFLFLHTDNFWRDYETYRARGVLFREEPRAEQYGIVAVFEDVYGNRWDLLELKQA